MIDHIALDCDGVIFDWIGSVKREAVKQLGLDPKECYPNPDNWGLPWMDSYWDWYDSHLADVFSTGRTYPKSYWGVGELRKYCEELTIVSHVPPGGRKAREEWFMKTGFSLEVDSIKLMDMDAPKSSVGANLYIDDAPHVYEEITGSGGNVLLVDRPWNKHVNAKYRARSWTSIVDFVSYHSFQNTFQEYAYG